MNTHGTDTRSTSTSEAGRLSAHVTCWVGSTPQSIKRGSRNSSTGWFMFGCRVTKAACPHVALCRPPHVLVSSSCPRVLLSTRVPAPLQNLGSSHRRDRERDGPTDITAACPTDGGGSASAAVPETGLLLGNRRAQPCLLTRPRVRPAVVLNVSEPFGPTAWT